jgi:hypothetical protein
MTKSEATKEIIKAIKKQIKEMCGSPCVFICDSDFIIVTSHRWEYPVWDKLLKRGRVGSGSFERVSLKKLFDSLEVRGD